MSGTIAARPTMEQVVAIVDFMEQHPALGLGQMRGLEGRELAKKLWFKLTRMVNNINGPTRSMKSWVKYWADKKSQVRNKVVSAGGDPNSLSSNIEKKIWDLFLGNDVPKPRGGVKMETQYLDENFCSEDNVDGQNHVESDTMLTFEEPDTIEISIDPEDRQFAIMEKLVKVMTDQASAMTQMAHASQISAQAMERLAEATHIQARAAERLSNSLESVGIATIDIRNAIVGIDSTMKRFYTNSDT